MTIALAASRRRYSLVDIDSAADPAAGTVSQVFINPDECIDCGNCASVCAQDAIFALDELPAEKAHFADVNKAYFN